VVTGKEMTTLSTAPVTPTAGGQHNDAYIDDASSTVSDEMFKSTSEGPAHSNGWILSWSLVYL